MSDLVEKLRRYAKNQDGWLTIDDTCEDATDEIERLRARVAELGKPAQITDSNDACKGEYYYKLLAALDKDEKEHYFSDYKNITLRLFTACTGGVVKCWVLSRIVHVNSFLDCKRIMERAGNTSSGISFDIDPIFFVFDMPVYASPLSEIPASGFGLLRIPEKHPAKMSWSELQELAVPTTDHNKDSSYINDFDKTSFEPIVDCVQCGGNAFYDTKHCNVRCIGKGCWRGPQGGKPYAVKLWNILMKKNSTNNDNIRGASD